MSIGDRSSIKRLIFIANACPQLAPQALSKAVEYAKEGRDTNLYQSVLAMYNSVSGPQYPALPLDQDWLDRTVAKNQQDKEKLEVELKMYTGNMIKESVRVSKF
jgi:COP9 signalosome complex subunit 1